MDDVVKKTTLRMIPYGIYILTAKSDNGEIAASTVNWVTQTSFDPPLLVVGVKVGSNSLASIKSGQKFALNMLDKTQAGLAFTFFKPAVLEGGKLNGEAYHNGENGLPIIDSAPAAVECKVIDIIEQGDHHIVVGEVISAEASRVIDGRPDEAILEMKNLGENVFYGG